MTTEKKQEKGQRKNIRFSKTSSNRKNNAMEKTRKANKRKGVPGY